MSQSHPSGSVKEPSPRPSLTFYPRKQARNREVESNSMTSIKTLSVKTMAVTGALLAATFLTTVAVDAKTLRWARSQDSTTLDPHSGNIGTNHGLAHNLYEPLVIRSFDGKLTGALAVSNGATLTGTGIIGGAATIAGALKPGSSPGDLTFNDSLTLESSAVLTLEITGTGAAGQFDRLLGAGTNTFTLGGTLSLDNTGFTPVFGQTILVFSNWGSFSGSFATITGADLGGGLSWDTGNLAVDGTMQVVPEPTTWSLLALAGGGALLWRLRRRGRR